MSSSIGAAPTIDTMPKTSTNPRGTRTIEPIWPTRCTRPLMIGLLDGRATEISTVTRDPTTRCTEPRYVGSVFMLRYLHKRCFRKRAADPHEGAEVSCERLEVA